MESSEEDDDFPSIESVTPQSKIDTIYQSKTEKGIRKLCFELLDLKDAVENLCGNTRTKYLAFLRLSEEVVEVEHELNELRKHISAQGILVQDLMSGVCRELDEFNGSSGDIQEAEQNLENCELEVPLLNEAEGHEMMFLENVDVLLAEHKVEEALEVLDTEERSHPELKGSGDTSSTEPSSYKSAFLKRKEMLEDQLVEIAEQPLVGILELKKALSGLLKLGKGPLAHQLLLKSYGSHLQNSIKAFLPFCHTYPETYSATLSNLVFSSISLTTKESGLIFGDNPAYTNRVIQWAECEIESFVRLVKENAPPSDTIFALHAASICVQASLSHCSALESQGLKLSKLLLVLLRPYIEEVLELNFRRARRVVLDIAGTDESLQLSPRFASPLSIFATSCDSLLIHSGMRFIFVAKALFGKLQQLATVAGDVLLGKERIQKILLARLTETVVMWLSDEQEFWGVLEDDSAHLQPLGLQQLILDMHFTVEIARFAGYPSRHIHQIASSIITRAIRTFSARGINPQSALPADEWFAETAKTAIHKLLQGASGSDTSDIDEDHIAMDDEHIMMNDEQFSDTDESPSSLSTVDSFESFASAQMGELESPVYLSDPED
ncbi:hypothetical protein ACSBR2_014045 [Camellia fascicularis]